MYTLEPRCVPPYLHELGTPITVLSASWWARSRFIVCLLTLCKLAGSADSENRNDDFAVIAANGNVTQSLTKTNLYRAGVGQPPAADLANASAVTYCQRYAASGLFIAQNEALFTGATSPAPAASNNLFTFLANRFATSFGPVPSLGCVTFFGLTTSPVTQTTNGDCIVVAATINTTVLQVWHFLPVSLAIADEIQDILDGVIQPVIATTISTASVSTATGGSTAATATSSSLAVASSVHTKAYGTGNSTRVAPTNFKSGGSKIAPVPSTM